VNAKGINSTVYNQGGTAEQWIKEGKNAFRWTQLLCRGFEANQVGLQLHGVAFPVRRCHIGI
jgi:hypothetical protein